MEMIVLQMNQCVRFRPIEYTKLGNWNSLQKSILGDITYREKEKRAREVTKSTRTLLAVVYG